MRVVTFEDFWKLYSKSVGKEKCEKIWLKLKEPEKALIMETLPKYIQSTPDKQYRKNPQTYLNGKCWNDEIVETRSKPNNGTSSGLFQHGKI